MSKHRTTKMIVSSLSVLLLLVVLVPAANAQTEDDKDTSVSGEISEEGVELSFEVEDEAEEGGGHAEAGTSGGGSWYDNPVLVAILAVGGLVLIVLVVLAVRQGSSGGAGS